MTSVFDEQRGRLCIVCYHQYSCHGDAVPRILTCGHSFCTGCLGRLLGQLAHGHIRCPTCKGDTLVPGLSNDINKLSKNFGVLDILESIDEGVGVTGSTTNQVPLCNEHDNEPMKVFCTQDDQLICIYCQVYGGHQGHQCQLVTVVAEEGRKMIRSFLDSLSGQKDGMVAVSQAVNDTAGAVQIKEDRLMYEVTRHFEMLRRKLYQRENQVKILLRNRISAKVMLLDKQKRKLHDLIGKVDQLSVSCHAILTGPEYELVQQKTKFETDIRSLSASIEDRDLRPCTKDDLNCHLDPSLVVQVASHGILVKEPVYKLPSDISSVETATGAASTSTRVDSPVPESVGSAGDADRREGDFEHIEWPAEVQVGSRNTRQSSPSDVIIIYDDMDLDLAASSSNPAITTYQHQHPACRCQANTQHTCYNTAPSSPRQAHAAGQLTQTVMNRQRSARGPSHQNLRRLHAQIQHHVQGLLVPTDHSSSGEDDSPDLSELSDMELERPLRSAWTNRGGWSAAAVPSAPSADHITPSALADDASGCVLGGVSSGVGIGEPEADGVVREEEDGAVSGVLGGGSEDVYQTGVVETRRDEGDPWEVNVTSSPRRLRRQGHPSSQHQRFKGDLMCSVYNCTNTNCSFYVRCKNCSRLFCQKCVSTSISARRCYKRPRGHSFIYIPMNPGNTSANNNQLHQHLHHRMHHGHQRSSCLRQQNQQPGPRIGTEAHNVEVCPTTGSWHCLQCLTMNQSQNGVQRCINCGQVNDIPHEIEGETELMTFPPSPDDGISATAGSGNVAQDSNTHHDNPTPATESQGAEFNHENVDIHVAEVYTVENGS